MKKIVLMSVLLCTQFLLAQGDKAFVESQIETFIQTLETKGVTNYFYTQRVCNGTIEMFVMPDGSRCFSSGDYVTTFVLWKEQDIAFIKKIDNCSMFTSVPLVENTLFDYAMKHFNTIKNKPVLPYEVSRKKSPTQRTQIENCMRRFYFEKNKQSFEQSYKMIDITTVSEEKNIHYDYNTQLEIVHLDARLDTVIKMMKSNTGYKRE
jgi:hypothetical protein